MSKWWNLNLSICRDANTTVLKMIVMFTSINSTASQYDIHYIEYLSFRIAFTCSLIPKGQYNWPSEAAIFANLDNFLDVSFIFIFCRVCEPALLMHVNITILVKTVEFASLQMEGQFANAVTSTLMALIANKVSQTTFHLQLS